MSLHNSYILSKYSSEKSSANLDFRMKLAMFQSNYKQIDEIQSMDIVSIELKKEKEILAIYVTNLAQRFTSVVIVAARYIKMLL